MNFFKYIYILLVIFSVVSCIPNKDLVYLQKNSAKNESIEVSVLNSKPYRIQTNDILSISIKALDQRLVEMFNPSSAAGQQQNSSDALYFNGFTVDDHGNIRIPVLGNVNVMGFTIEEVREVVEKRLLDEYFKSEARLFVNIKLAGLRYTVNGEIGVPGTNFLYQDRANIMEAIANSGDITILGDRKNVQVIRKLPHGYQTFTIDLTDSKAFSSPVFNIQPNDYIYVKPLRQKSWGTGVTGIQSFSTIISAITLIATTFLLTKTLN
jgi:polysaccharide export outer membrane protein